MILFHTLILCSGGNIEILHNYSPVMFKIEIPYTYKFSRDVNFADDSNLEFSRFYFCGSLVITPCVLSVL